jgi:MFS family permease
MHFRAHPGSALAVLTILNFLNFIDRSILFQVQPLIQAEFHVSKMQIGLLTTSFMLCFIVAAPVLGALADRYPRRPIIVVGAVVWSVATLLTAATWNFWTLLIRHAIVGIGEACMVAAPGYVADLFPQNRRGRMLAVLFTAAPAGTAIGYLIGGFFGHYYGWRAPFYIVAVPGVLAAVLLFLTREPQRGAQDHLGYTLEEGTIRGLRRNGAYVSATLGLAMVTFALGGAQVWMPDFLVSVHGLTLLGAAEFIATIAIVNGIGATLIGGWLTDRVRRRRRDADYTVPAAAMVIAVPLTILAVSISRPAMFPAVFIAHFFLTITIAPLGVAIVQSVGPQLRSTAFAIQAVAVHLLGDAASAPVIGYIADRTGSLRYGFFAVAAAVGVGSLILFCGKQHISQSRLRSA